MMRSVYTIQIFSEWNTPEPIHRCQQQA